MLVGSIALKLFFIHIRIIARARVSRRTLCLIDSLLLFSLNFSRKDFGAQERSRQIIEVNLFLYRARRRSTARS